MRGTWWHAAIEAAIREAETPTLTPTQQIVRAYDTEHYWRARGPAACDAEQLRRLRVYLTRRRTAPQEIP
jgi:hypothetical protein